MKKFLLMLACLALALTFAACGSGVSEDETAKQSSPSNETVGSTQGGETEKPLDNENGDFEVSFDDLFGS